MVHTHINIFDAIVIGIMLLSCVFAALRGFVREILSLGAWIGAGIVTLYYFPAGAEKLQPHFKSAVAAAGFATLGIYIAALLFFSIINTLILKFVKEGSDVGALDNILGLAFGALRGALILSLGFFLLTIALPEKEYPAWMQQSVTLPYVKEGAVMLVKVAPTYLREISSLEKKAADETRAGESEKSPQSVDDTGNSEEGTGYNRSVTQQLDRMIESSPGSGQ